MNLLREYKETVCDRDNVDLKKKVEINELFWHLYSQVTKEIFSLLIIN